MEEKIMTKADYAGILKMAIKMQIDYVEEEIESRGHSDYLEGIERGLMIALEKIDASMFLTEE
jgi:hypothetical protein